MFKSCVIFSVLVLPIPIWAQQRRHFTFHYGFSVRNVPSGQKIEVWFPQAHSDEFQQVKVVSVMGDLSIERTHESKYLNSIFHAVAARTIRNEYNFEVEYDVIRRERIALSRASMRPNDVMVPVEQANQYLRPDRLVPVSGKLASIAAKEVGGRTGTLARARALYDYVFQTMRYDKTGTGWGRGDAEWACDSRRGNCTDFHSVFISMARSQHIPARFEIGFSLPAQKSAAEIAGYHCWADFYDSQYGWVPVDISEAWKDPDKRDYFFGAHDSNRVQFSIGRDLVLNPPQAGAPLNYFVYAYVEVNGKQWENISNHFFFRDVALNNN